jgi:hypothetical protein
MGIFMTIIEAVVDVRLNTERAKFQEYWKKTETRFVIQEFRRLRIWADYDGSPEYAQEVLKKILDGRGHVLYKAVRKRIRRAKAVKSRGGNARNG